ncbi:MAG: fasciclin domain-containing protein, partial [Gaiellaceae bacterium]
ALAAPVVVSALARHQRDQAMSAASVGALLIAERDALVASGRSAGIVSAAAPTPAAAEAQLATKAVEATREETARHEDEERRRRKYVWPFVALFAIAGVVIAVVLALTLGGDDGNEDATPAEPAAVEAAPAEAPAPAEPELPTDIVALARADGSFTTILEALEIAGLDATLQGEGPITLLAPTDAAFSALPAGAFDAIAADPERLNELLTAHIIEGTHLKAALAERDEVTTQDGRPLPISLDGTDVAIAGATIVAADQEAQNGVLQGLDALVLPEGFELVPPPPITLVDVAGASGQHTALLGSMLAANLLDTLRSEGPFTLFAPTDDAFAALPDGVLDAILADPAALEQLLTAHVTGGIHDSEDIESRPDLTMLTGQILPITSDASGLSLGSSRITEADIQADNGILHVVDSVILPEGLALGADDTVIDTLAESGQFGTLLASLDATGLTDTLRGPGPFTVFAFTDEAFAALPESVRTRLSDDQTVLAGVLNAHYANGSAEAATIAQASSFAVASGEEIGVVTDGELIWLGGSRIVESIDSGNAVIHVVDRVLIPPSFGAAEGTVNELLALAPVQFEVGSAELTPAGERVLSRAVAYLTTNPVSIEIGGHTDSDGDDASNQLLSEGRAQTVRAFLVDGGVDGGGLSAVGYGETQPIANNNTDRGKARNRRIDFTILG